MCPFTLAVPTELWSRASDPGEAQGGLWNTDPGWVGKASIQFVSNRDALLSSLWETFAYSEPRCQRYVSAPMDPVIFGAAIQGVRIIAINPGSCGAVGSRSTSGGEMSALAGMVSNSPSWLNAVDVNHIVSPQSSQLPATISSEIFRVGLAIRPRNTRSLPITSISLNICLRFPAMVISSTG